MTQLAKHVALGKRRTNIYNLCCYLLIRVNRTLKCEQINEYEPVCVCVCVGAGGQTKGDTSIARLK